MIRSSSGERLVSDPNQHGLPFLGSHRALAACTREFGRLTADVMEGIAALPGTRAEHKPEARQSPDRCIVQLGPVALTIAWLRSTQGSVASGELLVIVWRGSVAPGQKRTPERPLVGQAPVGATLLWEQVLTAVAENEVSWVWQPIDTAVASCSSADLAAQCVEQLRVAYVESERESAA